MRFLDFVPRLRTSLETTTFVNTLLVVSIPPGREEFSDNISGLII
ncbi:hypothetical protein ACFL6O_01350 [candidate division KSB1 bacterium]